MNNTLPRSAAMFLVIALVASPSSYAGLLDHFEAIVTGDNTPCGGVATPIISNVFELFLAADEIASSNVSSGILAVASGDGRRILALAASPGLRVLSLTGVFLETTIYENPDYTPMAIAQAPNGRIFVTATRGPSYFLLVVSPAGVLEATYPFPGAGDVLDVGPDGCTLYFRADVGAIGRFNGCTGETLSPFVTIGYVNDIDPLPDGRVLVAFGREVRLYSAGGTLLRTIDLDSYGYKPAMLPMQIALNTDNTLYIVVFDLYCEGQEERGLLRIAFDDGRELSRRKFEDLGSVRSLIVGTAALATVPSVSEWGLLLIAFAIATIGWLALRSHASP
jgi:hypothetical protein